MTATIDLTQITIDQLDQITDLHDLKEWTRDCTACGLRQESHQVTHSSGPLTSPIMFVGMNPGFCEDGTGIPFCGREELATSRCVSCQHYRACYSWQTDQGATRPLANKCKGYSPNPVGVHDAVPPKAVQIGPFILKGLKSAGQLLDEVLVSLGIDRNKIFITNSALCKGVTGEPKAQYINSCSRIRLRTQQLLQPKVIVPLGRLAIAQYTGKQVVLSRQHGSPFTYTEPGLTCIVVPTYHPSAILRKMIAYSSLSLEEQNNATKDITTEKWALYQDLATAFNLLDEGDLKQFLLPGHSLTKGKLTTRSR